MWETREKKRGTRGTRVASPRNNKGHGNERRDVGGKEQRVRGRERERQREGERERERGSCDRTADWMSV